MPALLEPRAACPWSRRRARLNRWGDVVCPECGVNVITPGGFMLQAGVARCLWCGLGFTLGAARAARGNRRAERWACCAQRSSCSSSSSSAC